MVAVERAAAVPVQLPTGTGTAAVIPSTSQYGVSVVLTTASAPFEPFSSEGAHGRTAYASDPAATATAGEAGTALGKGRLPRKLQILMRRLSTHFALGFGKPTFAKDAAQKDFLKAYLKKFDADEVEVLRKVYKELSNRSKTGGGIDKATFLQYFPLPGLWGERLFQRFDYKGLGVVDYEEFLVGLAVCCRGTRSEKVHALFQVFDLNGDGVLQRSELVAILSHLPHLDRYLAASATARRPTAVDAAVLPEKHAVAAPAPAISKPHQAASATSLHASVMAAAAAAPMLPTATQQQPTVSASAGGSQVTSLISCVSPPPPPALAPPRHQVYAGPWDGLLLDDWLPNSGDEDEDEYEEDYDYDNEKAARRRLSRAASRLRAHDGIDSACQQHEGGDGPDEAVRSPRADDVAADPAQLISSDETTDDDDVLSDADLAELEAEEHDMMLAATLWRKHRVAPRCCRVLGSARRESLKLAECAVADESQTSLEGGDSLNRQGSTEFRPPVLEEMTRPFDIQTVGSPSTLAMPHSNFTTLAEMGEVNENGAMPVAEDATSGDGTTSSSAAGRTLDVEQLVDRVLEECQFGERDALTFVEFKTWLDKHDAILNMFADCLHEEAWGMQGNALFRRIEPPVAHGNSMTNFYSQRSSDRRHRHHFRGRGVIERRRDKRGLCEVRPDAFYKVERLFLIGVDQSQIARDHRLASNRGLLACPNCRNLLVVCPKCGRSRMRLRLQGGSIFVECCVSDCSSAQGTTEVTSFDACWHCNWHFSEAAQMVDECEPVCEGWLYKLGRHTRKWRARYFVLVDNLLYYYARPEDTRPKGFLFLEGCFVESLSTAASDGEKGGTATAAPQPAVVSSPAVTTSGKFGFAVHHGSMPRRDLYCATEAERECWLQALRQAVNQQTLEGSYDLKKEIGRGKFSVVYKALCRATGQEVAVKKIDKRHISEHERELLRSEIAILRLMRHPHVIRFFNVLDSQNELYIVMELVAGGELSEHIRKRPRLPELQVNRIVHQLLMTVAHLHQCGIIHRDLKPENVLLTETTLENADIKITDFGLSCICGMEESVQQPCGTLAYAAPEVLSLTGYNHKADVWSVGVMAYLLLRGRLPFPVVRLPTPPAGGAPAAGAAIFAAETHKPLEFDDPAWATVCSSAKDLLRRMLQVDPTKRISAAEALQHIWIKNPTAVIASEGETSGAAITDSGSGDIARSGEDGFFSVERSSPLDIHESPFSGNVADNAIIPDMSAATFTGPTLGGPGTRYTPRGPLPLIGTFSPI